MRPKAPLQIESVSEISAVLEGTWLYDGRVLTGVRIVSCPVRYGTGDVEDPTEMRDDHPVPGFDVQWASPTTPRLYSDFASANFSTLQDAVAHAENAIWVVGTLTWAMHRT
jgi:hypothetical protein